MEKLDNLQFQSLKLLGYDPKATMNVMREAIALQVKNEFPERFPSIESVLEDPAIDLVIRNWLITIQAFICLEENES